jgi:hypothetical protein
VNEVNGWFKFLDSSVPTASAPIKLRLEAMHGMLSSSVAAANVAERLGLSIWPNRW